MIFLILGAVGVVLSVITIILTYCVNKTPNWLLTIMNGLSMIFTISLGFGWLGSYFWADQSTSKGIFASIFMMLLGAVLINAIVGGLTCYNKKGVMFWVILNIVIVLSITFWFFPTYNYNKNIESRVETVAVSSEKRELIYFCNIPVQHVSGHIEGTTILGTGHISGEISTSDTLPYWYEDKNDEGIYDTAPAQESKLVFVENIEKPYLDIVVYGKQITRTNHNNGKVSKRVENKYTQYIFYLPASLKQLQ